MYSILLLSLVPATLWANVLLIVLGAAVILWGADRLTAGAAALAGRMGISQMVIGLTIVAMGTSMPEFCVSLVSALKGTPDLAVGNVVGSNVFNSLLIVGCAAMLAPMTILHSTVRKDIPFALVASILLFMMCLDGGISRLDALVLAAFFVLFMVITLKGAKQPNAVADTAADRGTAGEGHLGMSPFKAIALVLLGLLCLIVGSNVFVDNASSVASALGVSDAVIGLTVVAMGTSLPELATSMVAAHKGNSGIAIGNVLGSNVFNILFILGLTGLICPMRIEGITTIDLSMMVVSMILLWLFSYTKYTLARWEGAVLTTIFIGYLGYLVVNA